MNDSNFIVILPFMINQLNLKGNELLIYAIIYGFSQDGESWFEGGVNCLADWIKLSRFGVRKILNNLEERELIVKKRTGKKHGNKVHMQALNHGNFIAKKKQQSCHPNYIRKDINNIYSKTFTTLIEEYTQDEHLQEVLLDYLEFRKKDKNYTVRALEIGLNKLSRLGSSDEEKTEIVQQSIENCWKSFFPLRRSNDLKGGAGNGVENKKIDFDDIEDLI